MDTKFTKLKDFNGTDLRPYMIGMSFKDKGAQGKACELALEDKYPEYNFNKSVGADYLNHGQYGLEVKTKAKFVLPTSYTTLCTVNDKYIGSSFNKLPKRVQNKIVADKLMIKIGDLVVESHEFIYYDDAHRETLKNKFTQLSEMLYNKRKGGIFSSSSDGFLLEEKSSGTIEFRIQNKRLAKFHSSIKNIQQFNDLFEVVQ